MRHDVTWTFSNLQLPSFGEPQIPVLSQQERNLMNLLLL